jgi:energy-coupling factor transporter ATP-binding protein EcfA2
MYVRLGFAVAAHTDPEVLLVDEVLAVGDAEFRQKCIQRIKTLQNDGVAIVFISHNLYQVRNVCNRGIFLHHGKIQHIGSSEDAILAYEKWLRRNTKAGPKRFGEVGSGQADDSLQLIGVRLFDTHDQSQENFRYSDPVNLKIYYSALQTYQQINLVLRIIRSDGLVCAMLRTEDLGIAVGDIQGQGYINLRLDGLRLVSGSYFIETRLRDRSDSVTLAIGGSASFNVDGPSISADPESGVFIPVVSEIKVAEEEYSIQANSISTEDVH